MSTRVQKGSTVFRPTTKPRPRAVGGETRQVSAAPETSSSSSFGAPGSLLQNDSGSFSRLASSMPPPSLIPSRQASVSSSSQWSTTIESSSSYQISSERSMDDIETTHGASRGNAPPPVIPSTPSRPPRVTPLREVIPNMATTISVPSRHASVPMVLPKPMSIPSNIPPLPAIPSSQPPVASTSVADRANTPVSTLPLADALQIDPVLLGQISEQHQVYHHPSNSEVASHLATGPTAPVAPAPDTAIQVPRPSRRTSQKDPTKTARKRKPSSTSEPTQSDGEASSTGASGQKKRRKRTPSASSTATTRRSRTREASPVFDPNVGPGEELDPTVVTMAALCVDTGQGRISSKAAQVVSNHSAWRAANREKRARMRAIMEAKKYGKSTEEDEEGRGGDQSAAQGGNESQESSGLAPSTALTEGRSGDVSTYGDSIHDEDADPNSFDYSQAMSTSQYNVQVRIGPNGETIIDEESLFVNRNEEQTMEDYTHVEESDISKFVNSSTYSKKMRGSRWSAEETELFYQALSQFGENYELISYVLPGRDRKACKNKFKAEDKKNPSRITHCLNNRIPYDIQTLSRLTGKDFSGPTPVIRARDVPKSSELATTQPREEKREPIRKKSRTPAAVEDGVEILGAVGDMDED